jgi:hypothetical protein
MTGYFVCKDCGGSLEIYSEPEFLQHPQKIDCPWCDAHSMIYCPDFSTAYDLGSAVKSIRDAKIKIGATLAKIDKIIADRAKIEAEASKAAELADLEAQEQERRAAEEKEPEGVKQ